MTIGEDEEIEDVEEHDSDFDLPAITEEDEE